METTVAVLILVGAILLFLETILPGMVAGIVGLLCLVAGIAVGYRFFPAPIAHGILLGVLAGLIVLTLCWLKYFPDSRLAKKFISRRTVGEIGTEKPELLNRAGVACSNLRPSGMALIDGRRVDVVTEGQMIERGSRLKVVGIEGMRIIVRAV